jgi:glycosyltransferase involved in cell wall biosynthesis
MEANREQQNGEPNALRAVSQSRRQNAANPKLVRIIARLNVGGPARQACLLHDKLVDHFDTHLITGSLAHSEQDMSYLLSSEHHVLRLPQMSREISFWADSLAFWTILKFLRKERPGIVHTHTAKAGALGRLAAWLAGVPVIVHTYHGHVLDGYFGVFKSKAYLSLERMLGRLSTRVIAVSESQLQDLCFTYRVVPRNKISIIQNGFELDHFSQGCREEARKQFGLATDDFVVVWAGRLVPVKDVQLLGKVIRRAADTQSKLRFLVVGQGPDQPQLDCLIQGCRNVRLLGWRRDMELIWSAADVALLTSRNEGTPTTLIEAMAAGRPFVSTNVGAVRDLAVGPLRELPDGIGHRAANGFLTSRTPEALLYCIEQVAGDPLMAKGMALAGRAFALDRFSAPRLIEELKLLYETLATNRCKAAPARVEQSEAKSSQAEDGI